LVSVSFPEGFSSSFDRDEFGLGRFPRVQSYRGYVFGSLNANVRSLEDWLGPAKEYFDWSIDKDETGPIRVVKGTSFDIRANWKFNYDNACDAYHVPFAHASTAVMNNQRHGGGKALDHFKGDNNTMFSRYLGNGHKVMDQRPELGSPWERARPVPGRETHAAAILKKAGNNKGREYLDLTGRSGINLALFPNLGVLGHGSFYVIEPISVDHTYVRYFTILLDDAPAEVNTLRLRMEEDFNNVGTRDDVEMMERAQYALSLIPEMEWLNVSKGLGTDREVVAPDGSITAKLNDDTTIRKSYERWKELMATEYLPKLS
jgi:phenylpropionate dioxygenase-like ring-hydroxylating dioxygenase large terminal subunit